MTWRWSSKAVQRLGMLIGTVLLFVVWKIIFFSNETSKTSTNTDEKDISSRLSLKEKQKGWDGRADSGMERRNSAGGRNILLDCGANVASTVELFQTTYPGTFHLPYILSTFLISNVLWIRLRARWFLDASTHLYKRVCPSVDPSVRPSVTCYFQMRENVCFQLR